MNLRHAAALALVGWYLTCRMRGGCAGCVGFDEGNLPVTGDGNGRDYSPGSQRPIPHSLRLVVALGYCYPLFVPRGTIPNVRITLISLKISPYRLTPSTPVLFRSLFVDLSIQCRTRRGRAFGRDEAPRQGPGREQAQEAAKAKLLIGDLLPVLFHQLRFQAERSHALQRDGDVAGIYLDTIADAVQLVRCEQC